MNKMTLGQAIELFMTKMTVEQAVELLVRSWHEGRILTQSEKSEIMYLLQTLSRDAELGIAFESIRQKNIDGNYCDGKYSWSCAAIECGVRCMCKLRAAREGEL